jgi:hypothetical protein
MVSMGLLIMIPSVSADVGTIITTDTDGAPDQYFREDDEIYYQIAMPISYAEPRCIPISRTWTQMQNI